MLVTANYKLSFDSVRQELRGQNIWLLVVDTRGINVWCAAGKGTFSAEEVAYQVDQANLADVVIHRRIILPQLSANGVNARAVKKKCGFSAHFGPIRSTDIPKFLTKQDVSEEMRSVTFTMRERAVLIPVEICMLWKQLLIALGVIVVLSSLSPPFFSLETIFHRSFWLLGVTLWAIFVGTTAVPLLLPWIPTRQFWLKGLLLGSLGAFLFMGTLVPETFNLLEKGAMVLWTISVSSFLSMNFTGSTPYTSLSGVAKEMRAGLAVQIGAAILAFVLWFIGVFI